MFKPLLLWKAFLKKQKSPVFLYISTCMMCFLIVLVYIYSQSAVYTPFEQNFNSLDGSAYHIFSFKSHYSQFSLGSFQFDLAPADESFQFFQVCYTFNYSIPLDNSIYNVQLFSLIEPHISTDHRSFNLQTFQFQNNISLNSSQDFFILSGLIEINNTQLENIYTQIYDLANTTLKNSTNFNNYTKSDFFLFYNLIDNITQYSSELILYLPISTFYTLFLSSQNQNCDGFIISKFYPIKNLPSLEIKHYYSNLMSFRKKITTNNPLDLTNRDGNRVYFTQEIYNRMLLNLYVIFIIIFLLLGYTFPVLYQIFQHNFERNYALYEIFYIYGNDFSQKNGKWMLHILNLSIILRMCSFFLLVSSVILVYLLVILKKEIMMNFLLELIIFSVVILLFHLILIYIISYIISKKRNQINKKEINLRLNRITQWRDVDNWKFIIAILGINGALISIFLFINKFLSNLPSNEFLISILPIIIVFYLLNNLILILFFSKSFSNIVQRFFDWILATTNLKINHLNLWLTLKIPPNFHINILFFTLFGFIFGIFQFNFQIGQFGLSYFYFYIILFINVGMYIIERWDYITENLRSSDIYAKYLYQYGGSKNKFKLITCFQQIFLYVLIFILILGYNFLLSLIFSVIYNRF